MRERRLDAEEIDHLRQRHRDHREIDAGAADRQRPGDETHRGGDRDAAEDRQQRIELPDFRGVRGDIACHAEEHRVAEGEQADIADQQIEGAGEQRDAQHLHHEERVDEERRGGDQRQHQHARDREIAALVLRVLGRGGRGGAHIRRPCQTGPRA